MRFTTAVPLGSGATGEVLEAWDPTLERNVALKLLHRDNPAALAAMLREARAQAKVEHPNVGKVYDVGEVDGRPYIAMQLVDGKPLDEAVAGRSTERQVRVMATIAEAVQAAHTAGLIHRDLKPANILVEEDEVGELTPYVLDFGIAREHELPGATRTGQMVGTPGYLSPEQARGDREAVDRRSDVFSLGVILYQLLAGRLPFEADSAAESVVRLLQEDPLPLQRVATGISGDLATIVMKCLEREPARRYDSAGALARDLERWLAGEPIEARPIGVIPRILRRARRRPALTTAVAIAALAILTAAGIALTARQRALSQARFADRFGQIAERVDSQLRLAHMLPQHDIRPARERMEAELVSLRAEVEAGGRIAVGPGNLALGRGFLRLGRAEQALNHLQSAWESGYQTPEVALALGRAHVALYTDALERAARIGDPELRELERERGRARHAMPAQELLQGVSPDRDLAGFEVSHTRGLLALAEGDLAAAMNHGAEAVEQRSWFYDGHLLAARAALIEAGNQVESGELDPAERTLGRALGSLLAAEEIAPSDPEPALGTCRANLRRLRIAWEASRPDASPMALVRASCDRALAIDPQSSEALAVRAEAGWTAARIVAREGGSPLELLEEAAANAERAVELDPDAAIAFAQLGNALWVRARWTGDHGEDPTPDFERAVESLEQATELAPGDVFSQLSLGHVLNDWGAARMRRGEDPTEVQDRARKTYLAALEGRSSSRLYNGLCGLDSDVAYSQLTRGEDPTLALDRAASTCRQALAINPQYMSALNNLGLVRWTEAEHLMNTGGDPVQALADAIARFEAILDIDPGRPTTSVNLANLLITLARHRFDGDEDPSDLLDRSAAVAENVRERFPDEHAYLNSKVALLRGEIVARTGRSPLEHYATALAQARECVRLGIGPPGLMLQVSTHARRAEWHAGADPAEVGAAVRDAAAGLELVEQVLESEREHVDALAERARLTALRSRLETDSAERERWSAIAAESASSAIERRPALEAELGSIVILSKRAQP